MRPLRLNPLSERKLSTCPVSTVMPARVQFPAIFPVYQIKNSADGCLGNTEKDEMNANSEPVGWTRRRKTTRSAYLNFCSAPLLILAAVAMGLVGNSRYQRFQTDDGHFFLHDLTSGRWLHQKHECARCRILRETWRPNATAQDRWEGHRVRESFATHDKRFVAEPISRPAATLYQGFDRSGIFSGDSEPLR